MVVGGLLTIWHIMKHFAHYGHREFYVALGYKGDVIRRFSCDYALSRSNLTVDLAAAETQVHDSTSEDWIVHLIDTGDEVQNGGRLKHLQSWLGNEKFMITYGDGVSNVILDKLLELHRTTGRIGTVTAVRPPARYGGILFDGDLVDRFSEKPDWRGLDQWRLPRVRAWDFLTSKAIRRARETGSRRTIGGLPARRLLAVYGHDPRQTGAAGILARWREALENMRMTCAFGLIDLSGQRNQRPCQ
jgi:hypothetical protein